MTVSIVVSVLWIAMAVAFPQNLVDVSQVESRWVIDMKYATTDNFTKTKLYPVAKCLVLTPVASQLKRVQAYLDRKHAGMVLMFKDCYRPLSVQKALWQVVKGTSLQQYVANPAKGSIHNYGAAVDLTLADANGKELDMGTPYDSFTQLAQPRYERRFLRSGALTPQEIANRRMLRRAMKHAGFRGLRNEWWHFDGIPRKVLKKRYRLLDVPLDGAPAPRR